MEHSMIICLELPLNNNGKTTNMPNMLCQPNLEEDSNGILWCYGLSQELAIKMFE